MTRVYSSLMSRESLKRMLESYPKLALSHLPTRLEKMENLSRQLGVKLFVKRDDQTGLAFGGNKARKLDFIMADVVRKKADCIVTWAGAQSNWCRQTVAAAQKLGIRTVLVLFKKAGIPADRDGNLLLSMILGADIRLVDLELGKSFMEIRDVKPILDEVVEGEIRAGRKPYVAPIGGSLLEGSMESPLGAIAYVNAVLEMEAQAQALGVRIDYVLHATGSGSTQAGLLTGALIGSPDMRVIGISVSEDRETVVRYVEDISNHVLAECGISKAIERDSITVFDEYIGPGYAVLDERTTNAIRLVARTEGILLDPVYTGKAMAGLLDLIEKGYFERGSNIVFLHSGGTPALFPYRNELASEMR